MAGTTSARADFTRTDAPCIFCANGDHLAMNALPRLGAEFFTGRPVVGIWFWETQVPPDYAKAAYGLVDEIWTCSGFVRDAFAKGSDVPVRVFPHPFDLDKLAAASVPPKFCWDGRFVYLFSFDYHSSMNRKNPAAVCAAFCKAFPVEGLPIGPEGKVPLLVIKSINANRHPADMCLLKSIAGTRADIVLLDGFLPTEEKNGLATRADCYVSLHRSEGFGMTILEAMAMGKPCIATGYSGNMEFMTAENSFPVRFTMVPVGPGDLHYPKNDLWAEADTDHAAECMRFVADHPDEAARRGTRAREDIASTHSLAAVGHILAGMLDDLSVRPLRQRNFDLVQPPHRRAATRLKQLKAKIKQAAASKDKNPRARHHAPDPLRTDLLHLLEATELVLKAGKERENHLRRRIAFLEVAVARTNTLLADLLAARDGKPGQ